MGKKEIPIEQFHLMKNSYGRICLAHGGYLLCKLGDIKFFESALMSNFYPVYDEKDNLIKIEKQEK